VGIEMFGNRILVRADLDASEVGLRMAMPYSGGRIEPLPRLNVEYSEELHHASLIDRDKTHASDTESAEEIASAVANMKPYEPFAVGIVVAAPEIPEAPEGIDNGPGRELFEIAKTILPNLSTASAPNITTGARILFEKYLVTKIPFGDNLYLVNGNGIVLTFEDESDFAAAAFDPAKL